MLYLSRKIGESIIINNSIEITVMEVRGRVVKLGLNFPADASVLRKEVHDRITHENQMASGSHELFLESDGDAFDDIDLGAPQDDTP